MQSLSRKRASISKSNKWQRVARPAAKAEVERHAKIREEAMQEYSRRSIRHGISRHRTESERNFAPRARRNG
jgi:hypothetical protein